MKQRDVDSMESRHITPAAGRTQVELRRAALLMATVALEDPDLTDENAQFQDLSFVLDALGYRVKAPVGAVEHYVDAYGRVNRGHVLKREAKRKKRRYEKGETEVTATPIQGYNVRRHGLEPVCGADRGTLRGYNRHITAYNTACNDCVHAHQAALDERWERLGIPSHARDGVSRW